MRYCLAALVWLSFAALIPVGELRALDVQVYSEFRRVDPFGNFVEPDSKGPVREILSPLLARNGHATFQVVVRTTPGEYYYLFVGTNPQDLFRISVYKQIWTKEGEDWIPNQIVPVTLPHLSRIPDPTAGIDGQVVECYLLDVFVPAETQTGRVKLEPQIHSEGVWATYPMEVRISDVTVPPHNPTAGLLPNLSEPAYAAIVGPIREYLCGKPEKGGGEQNGILSLIRRNVLEDLAVARSRETELGKERIAEALLGQLSMDAAKFCAASAIDSAAGAEWYLRGRDFLYTGGRRRP
jgi:hypothetical protein